MCDGQLPEWAIRDEPEAVAPDGHGGALEGNELIEGRDRRLGTGDVFAVRDFREEPLLIRECDQAQAIRADRHGEFLEREILAGIESRKRRRRARHVRAVRDLQVPDGRTGVRDQAETVGADRDR
jgi:hypothetical protein